jgi:hypothetical protein
MCRLNLTLNESHSSLPAALCGFGLRLSRFSEGAARLGSNRTSNRKPFHSGPGRKVGRPGCGFSHCSSRRLRGSGSHAGEDLRLLPSPGLAHPSRSGSQILHGCLRRGGADLGLCSRAEERLRHNAKDYLFILGAFAGGQRVEFR